MVGCSMDMHVSDGCMVGCNVGLMHVATARSVMWGSSYMDRCVGQVIVPCPLLLYM